MMKSRANQSDLRIKETVWRRSNNEKNTKTRSRKGNRNQGPSPVESPIYVTEKSPCGQVDSLLGFKLLTPRQKVLLWTLAFLFIKLNYQRRGRKNSKYLFTDVCPCSIQVDLDLQVLQKVLWYNEKQQ
jgi:hypothetical protein